MKAKIWYCALYCLFIGICINKQAQEEKKKKGLNLGERVGKMTGDLLTSKTADLKLVVAKPTYYYGVFPLSVNTSASKLMPDDMVEGDRVVSISFFKNEGAGLYKIKGDVLCNGKPMEYIGVGSYMTHSSIPFNGNPRLKFLPRQAIKQLYLYRPYRA